DWPSVDAEAFLDAFQMGRAEQAGAVAGCREHRADHGRRGAFALRAGDVNDFERRVRLAKPREQLPHAVELELPLLVGGVGEALVVDAAHQPVMERFARRAGAYS